MANVVVCLLVVYCLSSTDTTNGSTYEGVTLGPGTSAMCTVVEDVNFEDYFAFCFFIASPEVVLRKEYLMLVRLTENLTIIVYKEMFGFTISEECNFEVTDYNFEIALPPDVWRRLCCQFFLLYAHKVTCYVDGKVERVSSKQVKHNETLESNIYLTMSLFEDVSLNYTILSQRLKNNESYSEFEDTGSLLTPSICFRSAHTLVSIVNFQIWFTKIKDYKLLDLSDCRQNTLINWSIDITKWFTEGKISLNNFDYDEICSDNLLYFLLQLQGNSKIARVFCESIGGNVVSIGLLTPEIINLSKGMNSSCITDDNLVSWLQQDNEKECKALSVSGFAVSVPCVRHMPCTVCSTSKTYHFTLYGHDGDYFGYKYYLKVDKEGSPFWFGELSSLLILSNNSWILSSALHRIQWKLYEDAALPSGRRKWLVPQRAAEDAKIKLAFVICKTWQFGCNNGECVDITMRCDDITDCSDESDEDDCIKVVLDDEEDHFYTPVPRENETHPIDLYYHVNVYNLMDMTTIEGKADFDMGITTNWYDLRATFFNLKEGVKNYFPCEKIWIPIVRAVTGDGEGSVLPTDQYENFCNSYYLEDAVRRPYSDAFMSHTSDGSEVIMEYYLGLLAKVPCRFELSRYPFDTQMCNISFMLMNAPSTMVFKKALPGWNVPYLNAKRNLLEYKLTDITTRISYFLQGTDNNSYFVVTFHMQRMYGYHVLNSFFPSLLIYLISYTTFYFQLDDFQNRITISLTAQLVLASLFTATTSASVATPYMKLIDLWFAAFIAFGSIIVFLQTFINGLLNSDNILPILERVVGLSGTTTTPVTKILVVGDKTRHGVEITYPGWMAARRWNFISNVFSITTTIFFVFIYSLIASEYY